MRMENGILGNHFPPKNMFCRFNINIKTPRNKMLLKTLNASSKLVSRTIPAYGLNIKKLMLDKTMVVIR